MENERKITRVVQAVRDLARAEASSRNTEPDSMGTYYEEKELTEALTDLLGGEP